LGALHRVAPWATRTGAGGPFISVDKLDLKKYAARPALAKVLADYILYVDHNPNKCLELAAAATVHAGYDDWWWKARLGKCACDQHPGRTRSTRTLAGPPARQPAHGSYPAHGSV
jgi:tetratricopeptide repeat protein 8